MKQTGKWAQTTNMQLALETLYTAIDAPPGFPRLATFYGPSGYGKTVAAAAAAAKTTAAYLRVQSIWTQKNFLEELARELGVLSIANTAVRILRQIEDRIEHSPTPIIIDEMDNIVERRSVEIIRDIADATDAPILLIGEESLPAKLKEWERFDNRIIAHVAAQPSGLADGLLLRDIYANGVDIADDLIAHFVRECRGITRRIAVNIYNAQRIAVDELESKSIDLEGWGDRPVVNGEIPRRRKLIESL